MSVRRRRQRTGGTLHGLVCIITGAGRGIGRAIALALSEEGASLVLVARTASQLERVRREAARRTRSVLAVRADVRRRGDVRRVVRTALTRLGRIDVLINNAGIRPVSAAGEMLKTPPADFDRILDVNLRGAFFCIREVLPAMIRRGRGDIINVGSIASLEANSPGNLAYRASKFGLRALSQTLFHEVGPHGIRVCLVCPGDTLTGLQRHRIRLGEDPAHWLLPEDVAAAVAFVLRLDRRAAVPILSILPTPRDRGAVAASRIVEPKRGGPVNPEVQKVARSRSGRGVRRQGEGPPTR